MNDIALMRLTIGLVVALTFLIGFLLGYMTCYWSPATMAWRRGVASVRVRGKRKHSLGRPTTIQSDNKEDSA